MNNNAASSPIFATAREQLRLLREKKIGAVELLDLALARVREINPALNAIVASTRSAPAPRRDAPTKRSATAGRSARCTVFP